MVRSLTLLIDNILSLNSVICGGVLEPPLDLIRLDVIVVAKVLGICPIEAIEEMKFEKWDWDDVLCSKIGVFFVS